MSYKNIIYCNKCYNNKFSHSFRLIDQQNKIVILQNILPDNLESDLLNNLLLVNTYLFYTKIAEANDYNDTPGILQHYRNLLKVVSPNKWIWIFDCKDLELKHCFEISTAKGILEILKDNGKINTIFIINSNRFLTFILDTLKNFIDDNISKKIIILNL
jgi:hypothetical protein